MALTTTTVIFLAHPGPSDQWAHILDESFAPYTLVCPSSVEGKFSAEQLRHRHVSPIDQSPTDLLREILVKTVGRIRIITDVGHQFATAILEAANADRSRIARIFVWWDNPHGKGIHPYCEEAIKTAKLADHILFASNTLTSADLVEPLTTPYTSIGYFPTEQADAWRAIRSDSDEFHTLREKFFTLHDLHGKTRIVAIIGGADDSWATAFPRISAYIAKNIDPNTAYVLCSHPRRKDDEASTWPHTFSKQPSINVIPIADIVVYASTTMAFTAAAAEIPAIQIGPKPDNDLLTTAWGIYPSIRTEEEWNAALSSPMDMGRKADFVRSRLHYPGWKSRLQVAIKHS